ncbi:small GTP-binding domain protein (macronuclear) [Tetrahymena thermophila SB210]|uniref:Small GTP-binding domain protein n=1 Tax=Tetrahymena thermophila (strain SB210) TaxID=312017 RepID=I7M100_TETTS|nr:small GTP-binding domain protein [Tetrahymena thermophila SB210]EAR93756.1 small GTP-binding domain protein [Tetrahymena thermophila SB210]|eukprot:XP_001014001.1 small GTP-binding domain protein [Tetrahymena thermophila SB210]
MVTRIDLFGSEILLRFDGKQSYQTQLGSVVTILIIGFISFRLAFIVLETFQRLNPQVIYNERQVDDPAAFNATSYSFPFAIAMADPALQNYYIDESIYTVNATFKQKFLVYNETTQNYVTIWNNTVLNLKPCTLDNFQNPSNQNYYTQLNYTNMYCLPPDFNIAIQGDFSSSVFSFLELTVQQCTQNCKSQDQMTKFLNNANFGIQLSDSYVDPTSKDNPYKVYSRDIFWSASPQLPKDVHIYLRNNYVYSDFGWFFSDIQTQKYPSFSYSEDTTYPPNTQQYILNIMIRFEKRKEGVYKRTYKNFNSIFSEIGGFTQSLLAIGYLFCKNFSKLKLNLELINQYFNYDETSEENNQNDQEDKSGQKQQQFDEQQSLTNEQYQNAIKVNEQKFKSLRKRIFLKQNSFENKLKNQNEQDQSSLSPSINKVSINDNMNFQQTSPAATHQNTNNIKNNKQQFNQQNISKVARDKSKTNISNTLNSPEQNIFSEGSKINFKTANAATQRKKESQFKQMIEKKINKINVSTWEYFKSFIIPTEKYKKKKQIIKYSVDKLYHNLDIFNILKKLVEVEKLKRLLLDQDQLKLFDCLPNPTIKPDLVLKKQSSQIWDQKNKEVDLMYQDERSEMQKLSDAFQSYMNITQKQNQGGIDKKIINLLDRNLLQIFQKEAEESQSMQMTRQNSESPKCNIYKQVLSQPNMPLKAFQLCQQQNQIKQDSILDANSCNQSDLSCVLDEFMKVEVQNKTNQATQIKDFVSNQEVLKTSQLISTNVILRLEKQKLPNQFESKTNQLDKI